MGANIVKYCKIYRILQKNDNSVYLLGNCYGFTSENLFVLLVFFSFQSLSVSYCLYIGIKLLLF